MTEEDMIVEIGIDWARNNHACAYREGGQQQLQECSVGASPEKVGAWLHELRQRYPEHTFQVIVETTRGPLVAQLMECEFVEIYPLNPVSAKNYRKAFRASGAKDDPSDARLWLDYLSKHKESLRPLKAIDPLTRQLEQLVSNRRKLVADRTSSIQAAQSTLLEYYPQFLDLVGQLHTPLARAFFRQWPDLQSLQRAREETVRRFYHKYGVRFPQTIEKRLELIRQAQPVTRQESTIEGWKLYMQGRLEVIHAMTQAIEQHDKKIARVFGQCDTVKRNIVKSLPRVGPALAPRLWVAMNYLGKIENVDRACCFGGVAPVRKQSGKSHVVLRRYARPKFLHQTLIEFADQSRRSSRWAETYYHQRKRRGDDHWSILRSLAFKWLRILYTCWQKGIPYDEHRYIHTLHKRGSPYAPAPAS